MRTLRPNLRVGGFDVIELPQSATKHYLEGVATIDERLVGWTSQGGSTLAVQKAHTPNGEITSPAYLNRLTWMLHCLNQTGADQVDLPGVGSVKLDWGETTHQPSADPSRAYIYLLAPSLWAVRLIQALEHKSAEETVDVLAPGVHPAVQINIAVPGCASTVNIRRFSGWLTPGSLYVAVVLDRWAVDTRLVGAIEEIFEYGDHHGGKFAGLYRVSAPSWELYVRTEGPKGRDPRYYALAGTSNTVLDISKGVLAFLGAQKV